MLSKYSDMNVFNDIWDSVRNPYVYKEYPHSNIFERTGGYEIRMLVPGHTKSDIKISIRSDYLIVSSNKTAFDEKPLYREFSNSKFERKFKLPVTADLDAITAKCEDGLLVVNVPTNDAERPKLLEVQVQ